MPLYRYAGMDGAGHMVRGHCEADDKTQLAVRLASEGIFLVHCRKQSTFTFYLVEGLRGLRHRLSQRIQNSLPPEHVQIALVLMLACLIFMYGSSHFQKTEIPGIPNRALRQKFELIKSGMTRAQVEIIFKKREEPISSGLTKYIEPGDMWVEVPYDNKGGRGDPDNLVSGPARLRAPYQRVSRDERQPNRLSSKKT